MRRHHAGLCVGHRVRPPLVSVWELELWTASDWTCSSHAEDSTCENHDVCENEWDRWKMTRCSSVLAPFFVRCPIYSTFIRDLHHIYQAGSRLFAAQVRFHGHAGLSPRWSYFRKLICIISAGVGRAHLNPLQCSGFKNTLIIRFFLKGRIINVENTLVIRW